MLFSKRSEEYYIRELIKEDKNCWKANMTDIDSWREIRRALKKMKLNEKEHPFLVEFRKKASNIRTREEIRGTVKELYDYSKKYDTSNTADIV